MPVQVEQSFEQRFDQRMDNMQADIHQIKGEIKLLRWMYGTTLVLHSALWSSCFLVEQGAGTPC